MLWIRSDNATQCGDGFLLMNKRPIGSATSMMAMYPEGGNAKRRKGTKMDGMVATTRLELFKIHSNPLLEVLDNN